MPWLEPVRTLVPGHSRAETGNLPPLAMIDAFGWFVIVFVTTLFGIPYSRYFLRMRALPMWPTATGIVTQAAARRGSPVGYGVAGAALLYHCSVSYEYQVSGSTYKGWFALMAGDERTAFSVSEQMVHMKIPIRYNPKRPADSLPTEREVLGRKVFQKQSWLNPNVW